ncbi:hypothetical protein NPIL_503961 [Nephila pilipes]|uniref:Uncharacterized protein n=1 Tax=Nephila pilipes TaxID=299642 RepID=A0A8X6UQP7_NEPPI|nr:hypothetical protein NPIL_503961 [Nephila pilipes]
MDKTISLILKAIAKKLLSRIISIERGKLTARVVLIRKRHKTSLEMGVNMVETRREDLEHSNHNFVADENYNEKNEIEKDAIVSTLHNVSLDAEIHNTVTLLKNLERSLKNVKSVDEVCRIKRTLIALERRVNSSERMTNLSGLPVAQRKVICAPSNKSIEQKRRFVKNNSI